MSSAKHKLVRITTVPISLHKLLSNQLRYMSSYFDVTAVSSDEKRLKEVAAIQQVDYYPVEMTRQITPLKDLAALWRLYRFLKQTQPLIVHTHTPKAGLLGMLAAKMAGVPVRLHTVAGLPQMESTGLKRKILDFTEKITYACCHGVYPNSYGLRDIILDNRYCSAGKLKVIGKGSSNGIDTSYFDPGLFPAEKRAELKQQLHIQEGEKVLVFVGRMVEDKGIGELVYAFLDLLKIEPTAKLVLVGPFEQELNPVKAELKTLILTHSSIVFVDYQEDVRPYLAIADIFVLPSYREGFPNVVMQAGAMGVPSVVSNINGCNEIIRERENGLIVAVKNTQSLYKALATLVTDTDLLQEMAAASRPAIVSHYEQRYVWKELLAEYNIWLHTLGLSLPAASEPVNK